MSVIRTSYHYLYTSTALSHVGREVIIFVYTHAHDSGWVVADIQSSLTTADMYYTYMFSSIKVNFDGE